jgi:Domain of unknown function (DUF222)
MIERVGNGAHTRTGDAGAPSVGWASGPLGAVQAAAREMSRQAALRARAMAAFAATRPATTDRAQGERGAMSAERWAARPEVLRPVSEWAAQELSIALDVTTQAAEAELARALTLVDRLPRTLDALERGLLHEKHLWCLLEHVAPIADDARRAAIEADLLAWVAARNRVTTPAALADRVRRVVTRSNARDAARDLARALAERGVSLRADRTLGMSVVTVVCTTPEAQALHRALSACVDALDPEPGDARSRGQRLVDCLLDLVLRPGQGELPPVQALLTIVASVHTALGADTLGEVDGYPVPAEMARQLARAFAGLDPVADPSAQFAARDAAVAGDTAGADRAAVGPAGPSDVLGSATTSPGALTAGESTLAAADVTADLASFVGGAPEPVDIAGGPIERAVAELSAADFDRWLDELVRDAFGDAPAPGEPGWPPEGDGWDIGGWHDPGEWLDAHDPDPPGGDAGDPLPSAPDTPVVTVGDGWWAAADRAVEQAGAAVHAARLAVGAAQQSVRTAERADAADEAAWRAGGPGRVSAAGDALAALAVAADRQREDLAALLTATTGGGLADRPRLALTDAVSGALLTLTDLPGLRRAGACGKPACRRRPETCTHDLTGRPGLRRPGPSDGYRPGAELDRHVRARDRRCRFPGCRRRVPRAGELDHHRPHAAGGETAAANLAGYCTGDHRGRHQAPGWTHTLAPNGTLTVTTPTGLTAVTEPPPY